MTLRVPRWNLNLILAWAFLFMQILRALIRSEMGFWITPERLRSPGQFHNFSKVFFKISLCIVKEMFHVTIAWQHLQPTWTHLWVSHTSIAFDQRRTQTCSGICVIPVLRKTRRIEADFQLLNWRTVFWRCMRCVYNRNEACEKQKF